MPKCNYSSFFLRQTFLCPIMVRTFMYKRYEYVILHTMTQGNLMENFYMDIVNPDGSYHF
jgi:hypothetical protein